jgi:hypothetical protein
MVSERCWVESPSKTVWIVDRRYGGDLQVQGWSASDRTPVTFHAADGSRTTELVVRNAGRTSVVPGGTSSDERARYAFHTGGVAYPRPGCWLLTAEYGGRTVEVVVEKVRCDEAGRPLHGED